MTNSTKAIAEKFKKDLEAEDIEVAIFNADKSEESDIIEAIRNSDALLFGTSTRYGDLIGSIENILKKLKDMNLEGKVAAAFGSFGWSGEPIEIIQDYLNETNAKVLSTSSIIKSTELGDPDNGVEPGTSFEDVPEDWLCPLCGVGKDEFSELEE
eukprot:jgi/Mesvir1/13935/Mv02941-RA.1